MVKHTLMRRTQDLNRLYFLLNELESKIGGKRKLAPLKPAKSWPKRGVYFFFEPGEVRTGSGHGLRLVRIGTHGLVSGARSTLHQRLKQHSGKSSCLGGNHRGSIFRLLIGEALIMRGDCPLCRSWGVKSDIEKASKSLSISKDEVKSAEAPIEMAVSEYLHQLPFLCLSVDDEPGTDSLRGYIERNTIALTSSYSDFQIDPPSASWLGHFSGREKIRRSGLWNQRHVDEDYDPAFLDVLEATINQDY